MDKPIVTMLNWQLNMYNRDYCLSGTAEKHPSLGKNAHINHTSKLIRYYLEEDILIYETRNTTYHCPLKYMTIDPYSHDSEEYKEKLTHRDQYSDDALDRLIAAAARIATNTVNTEGLDEHIMQLQKQGQKEIKHMEEEEEQRLREIVMQYEDCVYLEISTLTCGEKLTYHLGSQVGFVRPIYHAGMFQDSVIYTQDGNEEKGGPPFDLSYFPAGIGRNIETYSWSSNIKNVVIKNDYSCDIGFNRELVKQGETRVFSYEEKINE